MVSPYVGPGVVETLLLADQQRLIDSLFAGVYQCVLLGRGSSNAPFLQIDMAKVLEAYTEVDESPGRTMLFLKPKAH